MTAYCFRLKFRMVTTIDLPQQPASLNIPPFVEAAEVTSNNPRTPGVDQWIAIKSCGYGSPEEAEAAGLRLKDAILLAGAEGLGADFGTNKIQGGQLSEVLKAQMKEKFGTTIRDQIHGIDVFEDGPVKHFTFSATGSVQTDLPALTKRVAAVADLPALTNITRTGAELINDSLFPMPDEARFLLRISAVEAMSEQGQRPAAELQLIDELIKVAPSLTKKESAAKVMSTVLREQRRQSVRQACLAKLRLRLGGDIAKRFDQLYGLRSKYLHEGSGRAGLQQPATEAFEIARALLVAEIKETSYEP